MTADATDTIPPTPLCVLTGFLGSGKTTLLQRVLAATDERVAVLVNEVADLPIDARLLADYDEDVLALPGGCICCTMRDDLHESLARLRRFAPDRIVLETSGLADPAPLLGALTADPRFANAVRLTGVVAVVDCERGERLLDTEPEARRQLEACDRIVISKADAAPQRLEALRERLAADAAGRDVRMLPSPGEPLGPLVDQLFCTPFADASNATRWLNAPSSGVDHGAAATHSLRVETPVDVEALQLWLRLAAQLDGEQLLRIKAVARCARTGDGFVLQSAGRSVAPPVRLATPPRQVPGAEVVCIERGLPTRARDQLLAALRQALLVSPARRT